MSVRKRNRNRKQTQTNQTNQNTNMTQTANTDIFSQEERSLAFVTFFKSTEASIANGQGIVWTKQRADGRFAILGKIDKVSNVTIQGLTVDTADIKGATVEVRLTSEDKESLFEALEESEFRAVLMAVELECEPIVSPLTLATGEEVTNITLPAKFRGIQEAPSTLTSMAFNSKEHLKDVLKGNISRAEKQSQEYRASVAAAQQASEESVASGDLANNILV